MWEEGVIMLFPKELRSLDEQQQQKQQQQQQQQQQQCSPVSLRRMK